MTHNDDHLTPFTSDFDDDLEEEIKTAEPEEGDEDAKPNVPEDDESLESEEF